MLDAPPQPEQPRRLLGGGLVQQRVVQQPGCALGGPAARAARAALPPARDGTPGRWSARPPAPRHRRRPRWPRWPRTSPRQRPGAPRPRRRSPGRLRPGARPGRLHRGRLGWSSRPPRGSCGPRGPRPAHRVRPPSGPGMAPRGSPPGDGQAETAEVVQRQRDVDGGGVQDGPRRRTGQGEHPRRRPRAGRQGREPLGEHLLGVADRRSRGSAAAPDTCSALSAEAISTIASGLPPVAMRSRSATVGATAGRSPVASSSPASRRTGSPRRAGRTRPRPRGPCTAGRRARRRAVSRRRSTRPPTPGPATAGRRPAGTPARRHRGPRAGRPRS